MGGKTLGKRKIKRMLGLGKCPHSVNQALLGACVCVYEPWIQRALWAGPGSPQDTLSWHFCGLTCWALSSGLSCQMQLLQQVPEVPRGPGQSAGNRWSWLAIHTSNTWAQYFGFLGPRQGVNQQSEGVQSNTVLKLSMVQLPQFTSTYFILKPG